MTPPEINRFDYELLFLYPLKFGCYLLGFHLHNSLEEVSSSSLCKCV